MPKTEPQITTHISGVGTETHTIYKHNRLKNKCFVFVRTSRTKLFNIAV